MSRQEDELEKERLLDELEELTVGLHLPVNRRRDYRWIARHACIDGIDIPNYKRVVEIVKRLSLLSNDAMTSGLAINLWGPFV